MQAATEYMRVPSHCPVMSVSWTAVSEHEIKFPTDQHGRLLFTYSKDAFGRVADCSIVMHTADIGHWLVELVDEEVCWQGQGQRHDGK